MAETPANTEGMWVKYVTGQNGLFGHAKAHGIGDAVKQNFKWEAGNKGVVFARGAGVMAGVAIAGDALFRGKTADGEDRSALARMGEFVLGTGVAAVGLASGKVR